MSLSRRNDIRTFAREAIIRPISVGACLLLWTSVSTGQHPFITVAETAWTNDIDKNKNPVKRFDESVQGARQLHLWTPVQGTVAALDYLKANGKPPVFHQWYVYLGPDPQFEVALEPIDAHRGVKINHKELTRT